MPQLYLNFTNIPVPETCLWEQFDDQQKRIVIETLARLLVQATRDQHPEQQGIAESSPNNGFIEYTSIHRLFVACYYFAGSPCPLSR